ncbi:MAG: DNA-protecting protein DprA [Desulfobacteraceae bacterium]|nr:MAG: DNA-protecting protein DprA [Desulfobacteraceae bacterium]
MEEILRWFQLKSVPGVGNLLCKRLIERFGSPQAALEAMRVELEEVDGISERLAQAIRSHPLPQSAAAEVAAARRTGCRLLTLTDPDYPQLLREIPDPPPILYVRGEFVAGEAPIAVVGSRVPTAYGLETSRQISEGLAQLGFTVVSGLALGIDGAAHEGALAGGGRTIAVLGSGLDNLYPPQHRNLAGRIAAAGAVISEFPLTAGPDAHHFPSRNRIISGMSLGTVVVEATKDSGSLITARLAADQNREVFAVPGSIHSFKSMGTHTLIRQGAILVESAQDIAAELKPRLAAPASGSKRTASAAETAGGRVALSLDEQRVLQCLGPYPVHIDALQREAGLSPGALAAALLQLELKGCAVQLPGKQFALAPAGRRRS